jgi:hypothetical protein
MCSGGLFRLLVRHRDTKSRRPRGLTFVLAQLPAGGMHNSSYAAFLVRMLLTVV